MTSVSSIPAGGVYVALFHLAQPRCIRVGRLGAIVFEPGVCAYFGTAQRNLLARLSPLRRTWGLASVGHSEARRR